MTLTVLLSCRQNHSLYSVKNDTILIASKTKDSSIWLTPKNMTVYSFLQQVLALGKENKFNIVIMEDSFPANWVKSSDIDNLIKLIKSKDNCGCFVNPLSSYLHNGESAELGGYAIKLIESYKQKKPVSFGHYNCPKRNEKEADNLINWWKQQTHKKG